MIIALLYNIYMLIYTLLSQFVRFSIFYNDHDILDFGPGTFRKPNLANYLDLLAGVGIFIPLTISLAQHAHSDSPVASAVFGYIVM